MKTRTNQPVFLDNGNPVNDSALGGTKLYLHSIVVSDLVLEGGDDNVTHYELSNLQFISNLATKPTSAQLQDILHNYMNNGKFDNTHCLIPIWLTLTDSDYADVWGGLIAQYIYTLSGAIQFRSNREDDTMTILFSNYDISVNGTYTDTITPLL